MCSAPDILLNDEPISLIIPDIHVNESVKAIVRAFLSATFFRHFHGNLRNFSISTPIPLYASPPP